MYRLKRDLPLIWMALMPIHGLVQELFRISRALPVQIWVIDVLFGFS